MKPKPDPKPNTDWVYSPPTVSKNGTVWIDAMQIPMAAQHQQQADERFAKKGWK